MVQFSHKFPIWMRYDIVHKLSNKFSYREAHTNKLTRKRHPKPRTPTHVLRVVFKYSRAHCNNAHTDVGINEPYRCPLPMHPAAYAKSGKRLARFSVGFRSHPNDVWSPSRAKCIGANLRQPCAIRTASISPNVRLIKTGWPVAVAGFETKSTQNCACEGGMQYSRNWELESNRRVKKWVALDYLNHWQGTGKRTGGNFNDLKPILQKVH